MRKWQQGTLEKQIQRLKIKNETLREKISTLKTDYADLIKSLRNKEYLLNKLPSGVILVQSSKIIDVNHWVLYQLDYEVEDILGRDLIYFIHPSRKTMERELFKRRSSNKVTSNPYETQFITHEGESLTVEVFVEKLRMNNKTTFLYNLFPLEQRKLIEKERVQAVKWETLNMMATNMKREIDQCFYPILARKEM